jgi:hypothetical protein
MDNTLRLFLIILIIAYLSIILHLLKKRKLNLKYTLLWLFSAFVMLLVTIFPQIIYTTANLVGMVSPVNLVFVLEGMFVLFILLSLTSIVSYLTNKVYKIVQTISLLEKRLYDLEKKLEEKQTDNCL